MLSLNNLLAPILAFAESEKRLFYVYLLSSFVLGMIVLYKKEKSSIKINADYTALKHELLK